MGEVWRARDTRLGREVAIKTMPPDVASDPDRLARFEREAKLLASLRHANIGAIHGLEEFAPAGPIALVLELVEGDTLADRIGLGPIPVAEALKLAVQICAALEAAHDAGVIHRDLKPANIKVTPDGVVKVLDFGLAKAFTGANDVPDMSRSPTISLAATQAGIILGTAAYMSPEQASGRASDTRADIWSFGVVLFEMLTGRPVFGGETVSHVLAGVLATDPPWASLPANLNPRLREVLERCLAKKPADRYRHIGDVRADIERVLADPQGPILKPVPVTAPARGPRAAQPWIAVAAVGLAVASTVAWWMWPAPTPRPVTRSSFFLSDGQAFTRPETPLVAISRDGARLAYVANNQIYVRNLNELDARPVPGTDDRGSLGAASPVFSPDGQWLVYLEVVSPTRAELKRVPVTGGTAVTLLDSAPPVGLSWPEPDTLLFTGPQGIVRLAATGGSPQVLIARGKDEGFDSPQLLPDGRQILFTRTNHSPGVGAFSDDTQIVVQSIGSSDRRVISGGAAARYLPTGHLVYAQRGTMFAVPFDPATATMRGAPVPVIEGVRRASSGFTAAANYMLSDTGTLAFIPGAVDSGVSPANRTELVWVDRNGREETLPVRAGDYTMARVSPDGANVALVVGYGLQRQVRAPSIWLFGVRTGNLSLLTGDPAGDDGLVWSSDSRRLFFRSFRGERPGVYAIDVASGATQRLASSPDFPFPLPWSVSPGSRSLAIINATTLTDTNIATLALTEGGAFTRLLHDPALSENEPSISPDGAWMAYQQGSTPAAGAEINIRPFPGVMRTRIPLGPGREPVFSRDGSELFFFDGEGISTAPIAYKPAFGIGQPRQLFKVKSRLEVAGRTWDVDASGKRFLLIRRVESSADRTQAPRPRIDIVLNWTEELKARVPVK